MTAVNKEVLSHLRSLKQEIICKKETKNFLIQVTVEINEEID